MLHVAVDEVLIQDSASLFASTITSAFIGHPYWTMAGADHYANMIN
jgi:hypothetical protein